MTKTLDVEKQKAKRNKNFVKRYPLTVAIRENGKEKGI